MPIELPDDLIFAKPFSIYAEISKAHSEVDTDGKHWLRGPIAPDALDYDGQLLTKAGIETGLGTFLMLGDGKSGSVDWGHMYKASGKNPKFLIAKGHPFTGPDGRPWLADELFDFKLKPVAKDAWDHVQAGGHAGHSMQGLCKGLDPSDKRRIIKTEIHLVTIDPQRKGPGNNLLIGPPESFSEIAKGILADLDRESLADAGYIPMPLHLDPDLYGAYFTDIDFAQQIMKSIAHVRRFYPAGGDVSGASSPASRIEKAANGQIRCPKCHMKNKASRKTCYDCGASMTTEKAFTTGSDSVTDESTGGQAVRRQTLLNRVDCSHCGCSNRKTRTKCLRCGRALPLEKSVSVAMRLAELGANDPERLADLLATPF